MLGAKRILAPLICILVSLLGAPAHAHCRNLLLTEISAGSLESEFEAEVQNLGFFGRRKARHIAQKIEKKLSSTHPLGEAEIEKLARLWTQHVLHEPKSTESALAAVAVRQTLTSVMIQQLKRQGRLDSTRLANRLATLALHPFFRRTVDTLFLLWPFADLSHMQLRPRELRQYQFTGDARVFSTKTERRIARAALAGRVRKWWIRAGILANLSFAVVSGFSIPDAQALESQILDPVTHSLDAPVDSIGSLRQEAFEDYRRQFRKKYGSDPTPDDPGYKTLQEIYGDTEIIDKQEQSQ